MFLQNERRSGSWRFPRKMLERLSVKKPYTILVAVIAAIALGMVSIMNMTLDLLPDLSLPYLMVITAYPGASPEKVESEVVIPMEQSLGTISGVKEVGSTCSENFGLVQLEFEEGTNMDGAMVKVSSALNNLESSLPEDCGTPSIMEISLDMIASMYVAVSRADMDIYELSDYVKEILGPRLERQDGVASITKTGIVERMIQVDLNKEKINRLNEDILTMTNDALAEAAAQLEEARKQVTDARNMLDTQEQQFGQLVSSAIFDQVSGVVTDAIPTVQVLINVLVGRLQDVRGQIGRAADAAAGRQQSLANTAAGQYAAIANVQEAAAAVDAARERFNAARDALAQALPSAFSPTDADLARADVLQNTTPIASAAEDDGSWSSEEAKDFSWEPEGEIPDTGNENQALFTGWDNSGQDEAALNMIPGQDPLSVPVSTPEDTWDDVVTVLDDKELSLDSSTQSFSPESSFVSNELAVLRQEYDEASEALSLAQSRLVQVTSEMNRSLAGNSGQALAGALGNLWGNSQEGQEPAADSDTLFWSGEEEISAIDQLIEGLRQAGELIQSTTVSDIMGGITRITGIIPQIESVLASLQIRDAAGVLDNVLAGAGSSLSSLAQSVQNMPEMIDGLELAYGSLTQGQLDAAIQFTTATLALSTADSQLAQAQAQYESTREEVRKNANLDSLLTPTVLSQMIYAQNFAMPAGYLDDEDDNSWLLKVGDEYEDSQELAESLLCEIDGIGSVRLTDVADVTVIDNAADSYARLNGNQAVLLSIYKSPAAGTNDVSHRLQAVFADMQQEDPALDIVELVNQGSYIDIIVGDIVKSMVTGALLAFLVLALFLRDVRPTLLVALSIPLSVLVALVFMYFSGLSLNIMTLAGLSLGIGMLVDNSVVVMENVFRLRGEGLSAPRAAVQGTRQVSGSIIASTLTTVCVFLPLAFTDGMVRSLLVPMGLSIGYCLLASLVTALTVIPAAGSTILRKSRARKSRSGSFILRVYEKTLIFCLKFKVLVILVAVSLLMFSVYQVFRMGIVVIPSMTSNVVQVSVRMPEEDTKEEAFSKADQIIDALLSIEGVENIGMMDSAGLTAMTVGGISAGDSTSLTCMITLPENSPAEEVERVNREILARTADIDCEITIANQGAGAGAAALTSSGLTLNVKGQDIGILRKLAASFAETIDEIEGFIDIDNGSRELDQTLHLVIDKDKAMTYGITTAQIYMTIMQHMTTQVTSTRIQNGGETLDVIIRDETNPLKVEGILDLEISSQLSGLSLGGSQASMAGASGSGSSSLMGALTGGSSLMGAMGGGSSLMDAMGGGSSLMGAMGGASSLTGSMDGEASSMGTLGGGLSSLMGAMGGEGSSLTSVMGEDGASAETTDTQDAGQGGAAADESLPEEPDEGNAESSSVHTLSEFARLEKTDSLSSINRSNSVRYLSVNAQPDEGYNTTLLTRELQNRLSDVTMPEGYSFEISGESEQVNEMLYKMSLLAILGLLFIYLIMVAQFQGLLAPMIVMFTIPLAFTGGMIGLLLAGKQLDMMSLMGFVVLMGTVVNNGIVFVDYTNQLRIGGLDRHTALIATGSTRMRPIMMTALTTILAMVQLIFGNGMGSELGSGMGIVIAAGLLYSTLMTLYIVPIMYDIFYKKPPMQVDIGDDLDKALDDAAAYLAGRQKNYTRDHNS